MLVALIVTGAWILSLCFHEFAHALVAYAGGDKSVREKGYLTLNPFKYLDSSLSIAVPTVILLFGGIPLPGGAVTINHSKLRGRVWESAVSLAGPAATALFAVVCAFIIPMVGDKDVKQALAFLVYLNAFVWMLNLLPLPPLDGYGIISPWMPKEIQQKLAPVYKFGIWILFALLWATPAGAILQSFAIAVTMILGVDPRMVEHGQTAFFQFAAPLGVACIVVAALVQRGRGHSEGTLKKAHALADHNKLAESNAVLQQLVARNPKEAKAWWMMAINSFGMKALATEPAEVERLRNEALSSCENALAITPHEPRLLLMKACLLSELNRVTDAISCCDKAFAHPEAIDDRTRFMYATLLIQASRFDDALLQCEALEATNADKIDYWNLRTAACIGAKRFSDGLLAARQALSVAPDDQVAIANEGTCMVNTNRYGDAIGSFEKLIKMNPRDSHAWYNKSRCYVRLRQYDLAARALREATLIDPNLLLLAKQEPDFEQLRMDSHYSTLFA